MERLDLLITGHPRGGTGYMAALCRACGLDVGHEVPGADGISSWLMAPPAERVCFHGGMGRRGRKTFAVGRVVHVVRDPLACIASSAHTADDPVSLGWRARWVGIDLDADPITRAAQSVVGWHALIRREFPGAPVVRLEQAFGRLPALLGVREPESDPGVVNAREHPPLGWREVREAVPAAVLGDLINHAREYGYEVTA